MRWGRWEVLINLRSGRAGRGKGKPVRAYWSSTWPVGPYSPEKTVPAGRDAGFKPLIGACVSTAGNVSHDLCVIFGYRIMDMLRKTIVLLLAVVLGSAWWARLDAQVFDESLYDGLRCGVVGIRDVQVQGSKVQFTCDLANTGRETLQFKGERPRPVLFTFDAGLEASGLAEHRQAIAARILGSGLKLSAGAYLQGQRFTFDTAAPTMDTAPQRIIGTVAEAPEFYYASGDGTPCPDLVVDTLMVHRQKSYRLDVTVRIRNQGDAPARLYKPGTKEDGMGATFFLGNAPMITRSSQFIQGEIFRKGLEASEGILGPGERIDWTLTLRPENWPGHLDRLQCQLDNFQYVPECDRTNNTYVLPLRAQE